MLPIRDGMTESAAPSLRGALAGGAAASSAIIALDQLAHRLGLTDYDLPKILGLTFRDPGQPGLKLSGLAWYFLTGGLAIPAFYWLGFSAVRRADARIGLGLGALHWLLSGLLLAVTRPPRPKRARGEGRPMGGFLSKYGLLERSANIIGHLAYGAVVGAAASR
jgi:hypothetical protein